MAVLYVLITVWLWSLIPLAVKVADDSFTAGFIGFIRLVFGLCFFAAWELTTHRSLRLPSTQAGVRLPGPRWMSLRLWVIVAGLGIGGDLILYALGLHYTTASAATLIVSTDGIMLALLGVLILRERMSPLKAAAGAAALAGLVLVGWSGQSMAALFASEHSLGNAIVFLAACAWATYGLGQRVLARVPGGNLFWIFLVGAAMATTIAFSGPITRAPITPKAVGALLYLGLGGTGLAYVIFVCGMARLEAATVGVVSSTLPIFTMVQAHYWLGEAVTPYLVAGAVLVMAGVMLILRHQQVYGE